MSKIGEFEFKITNQFADFTGCVTMKSLADMALHSAAENAKENGFGIDDLMQKGVTWVLARIAIDMDSLPKFNDIVKVKTWISSIEEHITERKFSFYNSKNKIIGVASSMWAVLDIKTRKAVELSKLDVLKNSIIEIENNISDTERVRCIDSQEIERRSVRYNDLDINNHVNSIKYIEWIYDTIELEQHKNDPFYSMLINYQYEVLYGSELSIRKSVKRPFTYDIYNSDNVNTTKIKLVPLSAKQIK